MSNLTKAANDTVMYKETPAKGKGLDNIDLYIMNVPCVYAVVQEPQNKIQSSDKEYNITVFLTEEQREVVEDNLLVNKSFFEVGKDKNKKKKIKYPLTSQQSDEDKEKGRLAYDDYKGLFGVTFTLDEFSKQGKVQELVVVGTDNKPSKALIGNGSKVSLKLWGYKNNEDQYNVRLRMVKIEELVEYEGGTGDSNMVTDDVFGVSFEREAPKPKAKQESSQEDFSDDIPFDADDFDDDEFA